MHDFLLERIIKRQASYMVENNLMQIEYQYISGVSYQLTNPHIQRDRTLPYCVAITVLEGVYYVRIGHNTFNLKPGDSIIIPEYIKHDVCVTNKYLLLALDYIQEHYTDEIPMEQFATNICISESYLYEIFRNNLGTSPIAYLNYYRLSVASEMLKQTEEPVHKIAELVGFKDPAYFTRLFCRTFGCSPRAYRKGML